MLQYTPYTLPLTLTTVGGLVGAALLWRRMTTKAEWWFAVVELSMSVWAGTQLVAVSATDEGVLRLVGAVGFPLALFPVAAMFVFTLYYTGRKEWVSRPLLGVLFVGPLVQVALDLLVGFDGFAVANVRRVDHGSYATWTFDWLYGAQFPFLLGAGLATVTVGMLLQKARRSRNVYRKLSLLLAVSTGCMVLTSVVTFAGASPVPYMVLTPLVYLVFGSVAVLTILSVRTVQLIPLDGLLGRLGSRFGSVVVMARDFVVEEMDAGVMVLDADRRVVDSNRTAKEMLGVTRVVGRRVSDVVDQDAIVDAGEVDAYVTGKRDPGDVTEEVWVAADGEEHCYEVNISPLDDGGTVAGYVVMLHDITRQKRREEALRERERALEATKRDLQRQKRRLEHQNERLDQFAGIVSHDLRNPLNVAAGHTELIRKERERGEDVDPEHVERIVEAHERMEDIVTGALDLARQGRVITDTEPVELSTVAGEAWENVDTGDATLRVETDRTVEGDRDRLLNVFENLFRNALEHGSTGSRGQSDGGVEHGEPSVTVTVGDTADGFYVADDGPGVPDARKPSVLDHGYTTSSDGTGLGLAIVDDVARAHGWTVDVTDSENGGARFEFDGVEQDTTISGTEMGQ